MSASMTTTVGRVKLTDLAPELLLAVLEFCPDVASLKNAADAHPTLYHLFHVYQNHLATQILRNELSEVYTHARVSFLAGQITLERFNSLGPNDIDIDEGVRKITDLKASLCNISMTSAISILRLHREVVELADVCVQDCPETLEQSLTPFRNSLTTRRPSRSERIRIQQAIYLFEILRNLCNKMCVESDKTPTYYADTYLLLGELHLALLEHSLAPWEMYQVIAIQAFFRRALFGFERDEYRNERVIPGFLSYGIHFLHKAICTIDASKRRNFLRPYEQKIIGQPIHALGVALSRGSRNNWTRKQLKPLDEYKPFFSGDGFGIQMWMKIEAEQLALYNANLQSNGMFDYEVTRLEGRLDLWSAALWDVSRWEDIVPTLRHPMPEWWFGIQHHCDPVDMTFHLAKHPDMAWMRQENAVG
ncbi:hypothetical protein B0J13DRAFT_679551 [Dactylonectria estremocensis]|uniref:Uncharacterized protein n=1 Tax=Dactylonectria estremocensis TaxID=1079267 RepID=A0A9P9IL18_9HYPO|nr:hypothetical protein B0J13DRAFT_679551 [Dactylonectria estremocensis]